MQMYPYLKHTAIKFDMNGCNCSKLYGTCIAYAILSECLLSQFYSISSCILLLSVNTCSGPQCKLDLLTNCAIL